MPPPEFLGRYAVRRALGAGGFAVVWLGYDDRLDDEVAIKVLAENFAQRLDIRDRFIQEARVLRRTRSQHVVEVYDIDELPDGRPYFVMTYADRGSLADLLTDGPLPADEALRLGSDMARGVQDLHDAGVVHRDIKPSNVLFRTAADGSRTVLVADLGLSRELARGSRITTAVGTPGFMAPEQAANSGVDNRSDVYSIGATVYSGLTGHEPPAGVAPPPPSTVRPDLPPAVDDVLLRAMAADPDDRWPTARALGDALSELRVSTRQASPAPVRRRRRTTLAALAGTVAIAAAGAIWLTGPDHPTPPASQPSADHPPGTRVPCATVNGKAYTECFVHARGDADYLLDFYSHNHEVVLWGLKPNDDTYAYSQRWQFLRIDSARAHLVYNAHTNRCLALDGQGESKLHVKPCAPADPGQLWTWTGAPGEVFRSKRGTCLDIPHGDYRMGTTPFAYECNGGAGQQWLTRPSQ